MVSFVNNGIINDNLDVFAELMVDIDGLATLVSLPNCFAILGYFF